MYAYAVVCDLLGYLPGTPLEVIRAAIMDLKERATVVDSFIVVHDNDRFMET